MKNIIYILFCVLVLVLFSNSVFADEKHEALKFFKKYITAANSYSPEIIQMYSPKAKIIRQVVKPDGELVDIETDTDTYIKQLKLGQKTAKLRNYKNTYTNITSSKVENGYKISSLRQPSNVVSLVKCRHCPLLMQFNTDSEGMFLCKSYFPALRSLAEEESLRISLNQVRLLMTPASLRFWATCVAVWPGSISKTNASPSLK